MSLGIVTSTASAGVATLNIIALALAYLFGGLFIIAHNLSEFKHQSSVAYIGTNYEVDVYQEVLGKRENFCLHFSVAISFLVFGLVPPLVYGFSFPESDVRDQKLGAVAMASLICITLLAFAKALSRRLRKFIKTIPLCWSWDLGAVCFLLGRRLDPQTDAQVWMVPLKH